MTVGLQLVAFRCPSCNADFRTDDNSVFVYCGSCGSGYELTKQEEWQQVPVYFARATKTSDNKFFSFWAFDAKLNVLSRQANKKLFGNPKGLIGAFEGRGALRFYAPAYPEDLDAKRPRSLEFTYQQPDLDFLQRQPTLPPVIISQEDARKIADYLLISSETEQSDMLRNLSYELSLTNPCIIAIAW
jgi:hypothetical protein